MHFTTEFSLEIFWATESFAKLRKNFSTFPLMDARIFDFKSSASKTFSVLISWSFWKFIHIFWKTCILCCLGNNWRHKHLQLRNFQVRLRCIHRVMAYSHDAWMISQDNPDWDWQTLPQKWRWCCSGFFRKCTFFEERMYLWYHFLVVH